ncbi:MAG: DNA polymerase I [Anaerolineae bacterium]|nr:MAG: DNA polymerase I [Anaerolineae bacterium]
MPPVVVLIDGHALAYRAFFALTGGGGDGRWRTSKGEPTAGIYGFTSVLLRILEQEAPEYLAVVFDTGKTFRDDLYPEYKATRAKMPEDLRGQIDRIQQLLDALHIPVLAVEGYEADDVLGSLARQLSAQGLGVKIFTGDRDLLQLVDERVIVNLPGRSLSEARDYRPQDVVEKMGVRPSQIVDYKALRGDSSDNIPGVRGVGEKTAIALLQQYGDLDTVYAHLDELKPGLRKKLETGREMAYLSRRLARIVTDLDVPFNLDAASTRNFTPDEALGLLRELEFRSLLKRLDALRGRERQGQSRAGEQLSLFAAAPPEVEVKASADRRVEIVDGQPALKALAVALENASLIAVDTETTSTDQMQAELVGISLAVEESQGYYIPLGHRQGKQLPLGVVLETLRPALTAPDIPKVGHNIKYDYVVLARHGLELTPLYFDTMIAEWLTNPDSRNLGLKKLAWVRLGYEMLDIEALIGSGKKQISMAEVPIERVAPYAADDVMAVLRLLPPLEEELRQADLWRVFAEVEMPLVGVLAGMEMAGIALDRDFLAQMGKELDERLEAIERRIFDAVGERFNLNSPKQLSQALFERLKLKPPAGTRRTATGGFSTAAGVLDALRDQHPVIEWVLEYRELSKLKSTYVDALPQQINPNTGRIHTSYNQAGSRTGRIASSDPNLQNIPIRTELGRKVRQAFVAPPEWQLLAVDYSQVELRIVAHMAQDEAMLEAFRRGQDIHATTAAAVFDVPLEAVTPAQRRHAKAINFGLIYGMSPYGLTRATDLTLAEAEDFVRAYFRKFPGVKRFLDGLRRQAAEQGYVETLLGRRRYFPGLKNAQSRQQREREEREAINAPVQGTAADIMKLAMIQVAAALKEQNLAARMLLQVHDELVLECPQEQVAHTARLVQSVMENAYPLDVPLSTEARSGPNWGVLQPLKNE